MDDRSEQHAIDTMTICTQYVYVQLSRLPQHNRAQHRETMYCNYNVIRDTLNASVSRCAPSFAHTRTVYAVFTSVAQDDTHARTTMNRVSRECASSALHAHATGYFWISWWSLQGRLHCNDHAHLLYNRRPVGCHHHALARQRYTANLM